MSFCYNAWSHTLREEHRLRVFEKSVMRKVIGLKEDEVAGEWRRLYNVELNNVCFSSNIIWVIKSRIMGWVGYVARMKKRRGAYRVVVGKPEEKNYNQFIRPTQYPQCSCILHV
jgi:hypothetical protein